MELTTDPAKNIAYIRMEGRLGKESILAAFDAAVADERYQKGMSRLWDFRAADLSTMDATTIAEMARYSLRFPPGINDVKVAFVASRELEFGLSRVFAAHSYDAQTSVAVFYSLEEAEDWLAP